MPLHCFFVCLLVCLGSHRLLWAANMHACYASQRTHMVLSVVLLCLYTENEKHG